VVFNPKIWIIPLLSVAFYSFYNWICGGGVRFYADGYTWQWIALITYSLFFAIQLIVFSHNKIGRLKGFVLTVFACTLSSMIYEIPFFILRGFNEVWLRLFFTGILFMILLVQTKYKPTWLLMPALSWLAFCYVIDFLNPIWGTGFWDTFIWLPRLAPIPLFLAIAYKMKRES